MNRHLDERDYLADSYSIADIACIGWVGNYAAYDQKMEDFPNLYRWLRTVHERPAVKKGLELGRDVKTNLATDKKAHKILFGQKAR